ncbi:MAG TPA: hypothetical protein VEJ63_11795, partial [Planctomycetota bacterium]|nr:hypothetical protein [Planctomycetota bacterium]
MTAGTITVILALAMFAVGIFGGVYRALLNGTITLNAWTKIFFLLAAGFLVSLGMMLAQSRREVSVAEAESAQRKKPPDSEAAMRAEALLSQEPAAAPPDATPPTNSPPAEPATPRERVRDLIEHTDRKIQASND